LSGSIWYDKSVNSNDALVSGSSLGTSGSLGVEFNGTDNYITYTQPLTATPSGSWTLQWYGTMFNDNTSRDLFCKDSFANGWDTIWQPTSTPSTTQLLYRDVSGSDKRRIITNTSAEKALWTLLGNDSAERVTVYKNTTLIGDMTAGGVNAFNVASLPLKFGFNTNGDATYFKGTIQDLIIYNRELSDVEISTNYGILSARSCPAGPTTTTTTAVPTTTTTSTTTTTIAPTTTTTTIEPDLYYTGVDCCGGPLTSKIMVKGGVAGGQPTPFPYGMYIPGKGCFNITALSTSSSVDFSFTTYEQKLSNWYGEGACSFCVSTYGCPTTTTTTTAGPTTTTTAGPTTTTTTIAPTTTTTTTPPDYYYYSVASNCCNPPNQSIVGVVAITSSFGILVDGQTVASNDYTSSTGTHCVSIKYVTSSITPLLFTLNDGQQFSNTYGLDQCNSCNRDYIPTPGSGICLAYDLVNANATLTYVSCSGTPTTSSTTGGTFEFCSRTAPVITYVDPIYEKQFARLAVDCANCGTY
jgi:hypothetical protein